MASEPEMRTPGFNVSDRQLFSEQSFHWISKKLPYRPPVNMNITKDKAIPTTFDCCWILFNNYIEKIVENFAAKGYFKPDFASLS